MSIPIKSFQNAIIKWQQQHGRSTLPWQQPKTAYRVWLSEIMLQQTQVTTVIDYFKRFINAFPDVFALAKAEHDAVMHLWSGLGYYARARNLHQCAKMIVEKYAGEFPESLEQLESLPGIGRSTAGAILSLAFNKSSAILDGNVKRVLTRCHEIEGLPTQTQVSKKLWQIAEKYMSTHNPAIYTQGMMDLGALICTRTNPSCQQCPVKKYCGAYKSSSQHLYPTPKPRKQKPIKALKFLIILNKKQEVLLQQRPPVGIWGGLWSFPECDLTVDIADYCREKLHLEVGASQTWATIRHTFTHFHLDITPIIIDEIEIVPSQIASKQTLWYDVKQHGNKKNDSMTDDPNNVRINPRKQVTAADNLAQFGLAAPVSRLLTQLCKRNNK